MKTTGKVLAADKENDATINALLTLQQSEINDSICADKSSSEKHFLHSTS